MSKRLVKVYKGSRRADAYLYVDSAKGLIGVPEVLLARFGDPEPVMTLLLHAGRKLARADAAQVLASIEAHGYYLQMPPSETGLTGGEGGRG